jgi:preprotein translocase subunit SecG
LLLSIALQVGEELNYLIFELEKISSVRVRSGMAILSLICNVERTSEILLRTFKVLLEEGINVSMMSQGASKVCYVTCYFCVTFGGVEGVLCSGILLRTFKVLLEEGINVSMMSQGASKVCYLACYFMFQVLHLVSCFVPCSGILLCESQGDSLPATGATICVTSCFVFHASVVVVAVLCCKIFLQTSEVLPLVTATGGSAAGRRERQCPA